MQPCVLVLLSSTWSALKHNAAIYTDVEMVADDDVADNQKTTARQTSGTDSIELNVLSYTSSNTTHDIAPTSTPGSNTTTISAPTSSSDQRG